MKCLNVLNRFLREKVFYQNCLFEENYYNCCEEDGVLTEHFCTIRSMISDLESTGTKLEEDVNCYAI